MISITPIILVFLGIFLAGTRADEATVYAQLHDSATGLGAAPRLVASQPQSSLPAPRISRAQATVAARDLQISGFRVDTTTRLANLMDFHSHYTSEGNDTELIGWTGNVANCDEGTNSATYQGLVLRRINYFRGQAGLSTTIAFDSAKNAAAQQAALVMVRQKDLSHTPFQDWPSNPCVTQASEVTASASNLSLGTFGLHSIDRLMLDDGSNNGPVGHRRWFLYPQAIEMGHGSIPFVPNYTSACVVWVVGDFGPVPAAKPVTWPNEGYCPYTLVPNSSANYARWSFSYPQADFSSAEVSMTYNGSPISLTIEPIKKFIGDNTLVWQASEVPSAPPAVGTDAIASITISGIKNAPFTTYTYNVVIYDPYDLQDPMQLTGPEEPSVDGGSIYQFNQVNAAEGYQLRIANQAPATWTEGAETLNTIKDGTSSSYPLQTSALSSGGSRSFHLLFPSFGEQSFEIDRTIMPGENSVLTFKKRFRFFYPHSRFRAEISDNDGTSWNTLYETPGTNASGSSAEWDGAWVTINQAIPDTYNEKPIRLRFLIETNGSFYQWNPGNTGAHYGVFVDDIQLTNSSQILSEEVTMLDSDASSFRLDSTTAGNTLSTDNTYLLQIAPIVAGHQFAYTSPLNVHPQVIALDPHDTWLQEHFDQTVASGDAAPESDADADGLSNLIERALGLDPTKAEDDSAAANLPQGRLGDSGRPSIGLSIPASPHPDLTYEVQQSTDLVTWTPMARKVGAGAWDVLATGVTVKEGAEVNGRSPLTLEAPALLPDEQGVHLRLSISTTK